MTAFPLDPETRAELLADLRARRGPFRYDVVAALELVAHYGVNRVKRMAAAMLMREVAVASLSSSQSGAPFTLFILEPEVARLTAAGIYAHYRRERGLPIT
jgi:hypothetical protein